MSAKLSSQLERVRQKPVIAICNGFQIAMRAGLFGEGVALTTNQSGTFRNIMRQSHVIDEDTNCVWFKVCKIKRCDSHALMEKASLSLETLETGKSHCVIQRIPILMARKMTSAVLLLPMVLFSD